MIVICLIIYSSIELTKYLSRLCCLCILLLSFFTTFFSLLLACEHKLLLLSSWPCLTFLEWSKFHWSYVSFLSCFCCPSWQFRLLNNHRFSLCFFTKPSVFFGHYLSSLLFHLFFLKLLFGFLQRNKINSSIRVSEVKRSRSGSDLNSRADIKSILCRFLIKTHLIGIHIVGVSFLKSCIFDSSLLLNNFVLVLLSLSLRFLHKNWNTSSSYLLSFWSVRL